MHTSYPMGPMDPFRKSVIGYPKLAAKIAIQPEAAIYRRFAALNAQNLLYLQAELADLEERLKEQQDIDNKDNTGRKSEYARNWFALQDSAIDGDTDQLDLVMKIREVLKEYNHALIQQSLILGYSEPGKWDLHAMQDYLQTPEMGPLALTGADATVWGSMKDRNSYAPDLVALQTRPQKDAVSSWAAENTIHKLFLLGFGRFMKPSPVQDISRDKDGTIYRITYWLTSLLASLIPIASIIVLYCVHSMPARFAVIAAFNVLLSVCLMSLDGAKRAEVIAITVAFSAVQVVFVGQNQNT